MNDRVPVMRECVIITSGPDPQQDLGWFNDLAGNSLKWTATAGVSSQFQFEDLRRGYDTGGEMNAVAWLERDVTYVASVFGNEL